MKLLKAICWAFIAFWCPQYALDVMDREAFDNLIKTIRGEK